MLAKANRLSLRLKFHRGRRVAGHLFNLEILALPSESKPKFAVVVSRKTARKAVDRNRLKRQLLAALSPMVEQIKPGVGVIVYAKPGAVDQDFSQIIQELRVLLGKQVAND